MHLSCFLFAVGQQVAVLNLVPQGLKDPPPIDVNMRLVVQCHRGKKKQQKIVQYLLIVTKRKWYRNFLSHFQGAGKYSQPRCLEERRFRKLKTLCQKQSDELNAPLTTKSTEASGTPPAAAVALTPCFLPLWRQLCTVASRTRNSSNPIPSSGSCVGVSLWCFHH